MGYVLSIAELAGLNAILALSVYATLMVGQFSLAQVGFWSIGAYCTGTLTTLFGIPLAGALLVAGLLCAAVGLLLGYPCLRVRGIYLTLATVAFAEVVRVFFHNFVYQAEIGGTLLGPAGPLGFRGILPLAGWPEIAAVLTLLLLLFAWLERSRIGLAAGAVREDETAAACAGIGVVAVKVSMFAFGAFVAGLGGGLYASYVSYLAADAFGFQMALVSVFFVAVGGSGNFLGPVFGAALLTALPEMLRFAGDFRIGVYGAVVLGAMIVAPRGLISSIRLPKRRRSRQRGDQPASTGSAVP